jgi:hypothetical protein
MFQDNVSVPSSEDGTDTLCNTPEEGSSYQHRSGSLKSKIKFVFDRHLMVFI